jgi:hypothetical protein
MIRRFNRFHWQPRRLYHPICQNIRPARILSALANRSVTIVWLQSNRLTIASSTNRSLEDWLVKWRLICRLIHPPPSCTSTGHLPEGADRSNLQLEGYLQVKWRLIRQLIQLNAGHPVCWVWSTQQVNLQVKAYRRTSGVPILQTRPLIPIQLYQLLQKICIRFYISAPMGCCPSNLCWLNFFMKVHDVYKMIFNLRLGVARYFGVIFSINFPFFSENIFLVFSARNGPITRTHQED